MFSGIFGGDDNNRLVHQIDFPIFQMALQSISCTKLGKSSAEEEK